MSRVQPEPDAIELKIDIAAPPEIVFKYFSDPQRYRTWMGEASSIDPRKGGILTVAFGGGPAARGEILEWIPNERLVFSWGHGGDNVSQVAVTLQRHEHGTRVILRHSGIRSEVERQGTAGGWRYYLSQLSSVTWSEKLKGRLDSLVDTYVQAWNENDAARRTKLLSECMADAVWLSDKYIRICGRDMINAHISTVQPMMQEFDWSETDRSSNAMASLNSGGRPSCRMERLSPQELISANSTKREESAISSVFGANNQWKKKLCEGVFHPES